MIPTLPARLVRARPHLLRPVLSSAARWMTASTPAAQPAMPLAAASLPSCMPQSQSASASASAPAAWFSSSGAAVAAATAAQTAAPVRTFTTYDVATGKTSVQSAAPRGGRWSFVLSGLLVVGCVYLYSSATHDADESTALCGPAPPSSAPGDPKKDYPIISKEEVKKHNSLEKGVWVIYKEGVYDVTNFIALHPGGAQKIMLAAGSSIEPFWNMYQQHNTLQVRDILAPYRIGTLKDYQSNQATHVDPYLNDPERHPALIVRSQKPFNAEPPNDILASSFITPTDLFFVRNHLPVPDIKDKEYKLLIEGEGVRHVALSLEDLKSNFRKYTVTAAIQCAGNRRSEMNEVKTVKGLEWGQAAISNATWAGVRLKDVLEYAGLDGDSVDMRQIHHVQFEGLDQDITGQKYGSSIPVDKALSNEVLLAYEMNNDVLSRDHGYPIRVIVPGVVGARNVKWLGKIITSRTESTAHWQQNDYKGFSPMTDWDNVDFSTAPAIQELPVTSAICTPSKSSTIAVSSTDEEIPVEGYAWSGGGRGVVRVDVSADGGKTWTTAELKNKPQEPQPLHKSWSWTLWKANVPISTQNIVQKNGQDKIQLICKAVDASYNSQPEKFAPIWNLRGCLSNAWHTVDVNVEKEKKN